MHGTAVEISQAGQTQMVVIEGQTGRGICAWVSQRFHGRLAPMLTIGAGPICDWRRLLENNVARKAVPL